MSLPTEWAGQSSEDHRATVLLRQEHETLLALFRRQREPLDAPGGSREALQAQITETLRLIDRIERDVFFPALPSQYHALVRVLEARQESLAVCAATVCRTGASIARQNADGERLELLAREHLAAEQSLLFAAVEREQPELNRALYDRLVDARNRIGRAATS